MDVDKVNVEINIFKRRTDCTQGVKCLEGGWLIA